MELEISKIAKVCHQANKAYCEAIGDDSQVNWEDAPEWQRTSAQKGVELVLANKGHFLADSTLHDSWMKEKVESGWVWGEEKDAELKTHPCIVPFHLLPEKQQLKDRLFFAVANFLIADL